MATAANPRGTAPQTPNLSQPMDPLLTERQAGELLGFSAATMQTSRARGSLAGKPAPAWVKIGRSVRYRRSELEKWLASVVTEHHAPVASHG